MLRWYLLTMLFAMSSGDMTCFFNSFPKCIVGRTNHEVCPHVPSIKCTMKNALECDVEDSRIVIDMKRVFQDACQEGTELYKAYLKHGKCIYEHDPKLGEACSKDLQVEIKTST